MNWDLITDRKCADLWHYLKPTKKHRITGIAIADREIETTQQLLSENSDEG